MGSTSMANRERFYDDESITIKVNQRVLGYLEDLAKTGLYGNAYPQTAEVALRVGLKQLLADEGIKVESHPLPKEKEG